LTMDGAVRNLVAWADVTIATALQMGTQVPADVLGDRTRGRLMAGARADLALWSMDLQLIETFVGGASVWAKASG